MSLSSLQKLLILKTARAIEKFVELRKKKSEASELRVQRILAEYQKEYESAEKKMIETLEEFFKKQVEAVVEAASKLEEGPFTASQIFEPRDWNRSIVDYSLPVIAEIMGKTAHAEMERLGIDLAILKKSVSGSDWLDNEDDSTLDEVEFSIDDILISMGFLKEYPPWMKQAIRDILKESFLQEHWKDINETTLKKLEELLLEGAFEGKSIASIAKGIEEALGAEWIKDRATNIARTEIGHALNAARSMSMDALIEAVGVDVPMKKQWMSVLGATTRASHANLDGVPADANNRWYLGGVYCRWPGDYILPARERCNCQCSIVMVFGLNEEDARLLIQEYSERIATKKCLRKYSFNLTS